MECPDCKKQSYKTDVCTNCGLVFISNPIDYNLPYQDDYDTLIEKKQSQSVMIKKRDVKNQDLKRALRKYYYPWENKRDAKIRNELKRIVGLLNLGKNFYSSCYYRYCKIAKYNEKSETSLFKAGKLSIEIVAQGIAYLEIKERKLPFTLNDFDKIDCNKQDIVDYYKRLIKEFHIKIEQTTPSNFVQKIVVALKIEPRKEFLLIVSTKELLKKISKIEKDLNLLSQFRKPIDRAGACIYILSSDEVTQKKICDIIGCNVQTLRKRIKEIKICMKIVDKNDISKINKEIPT